MSKRAKIILVIVVIAFAGVLLWLGSKNKQDIQTFQTETAFKATKTSPNLKSFYKLVLENML